MKLHAPRWDVAGFLAALRAHPKISLLESVTLFYLALPLFLFVFGWLKLGFAMVFAMILAPALCLCFVRALNDGASTRDLPGWKPPLSWPRIGIILALSTIAAVAVGIGGMVPQFTDYYKHNMVLLVLIDQPWPFGYAFTDPAGEPREFVPPYYFGYYLPAAFVGKFFGWAIGYFMTLVWAVLGISLAIVWFLRLCRSGSVWYILLFILFGGLDVLGLIVLQHRFEPLAQYFSHTGIAGFATWLASKGQLEFAWPMLAFQMAVDVFNLHVVWYLGQLNRIYFGPHHTITTWIVVLVVLHDALRRNTIERAGLIWVPLMFGSIFGAMGAVAIVGLAALQTRMRGAISWENIAGIPYLILFYLFYTTVDGETMVSTIWNAMDLTRGWWYLLVLYAMAFGVYAILAPRPALPTLAPGRLWWWGVILLMVVIPWVSMGPINDFAVHALIPPMTVFLVCLATRLRTDNPHRCSWRHHALIAALVIGTISSWGILYHAVALGFQAPPPPLHQVRSPNETVPRNWIMQMTSDPEAIFWKHLARPVVLVPEKEIPVLDYWEAGDERIGAYWDGPGLNPDAPCPEPGEPFLRYIGPPFPGEAIGGLAVWTAPLPGLQTMDAAVPTVSLDVQWRTQTLVDDQGWGPNFLLHRTRGVGPRVVDDFVVWEELISQYTYWRGDIVELEFRFDPPADMDQCLEVLRIEFLER